MSLQTSTKRPARNGRPATTPYERIRHAVAHTYSPVSVDAVADDARTAPKTVRKHLNSLADEGFVETAPGEQGARSIATLPNHSSSNRLLTFSITSRPTNSSPESMRCASSSPSIGTNSVLTHPKNWRSSRRIRHLPRPEPHRTRSIQKRFVSGRLSLGTSRSRTLPS